MPLSEAQVIHQQKIQAAKKQLEEQDGRRIKADKIQEWALLEIAERLSGIEFQLGQVHGRGRELI